MKLSFLNLLACPSCQSDLALTTFEENQVNNFKNVSEGILNCTQCKTIYPIFNSVPRLLPNALHLFPEFKKKWSTKLKNEFSLSEKELQANAELEREYQQVARHFQNQWKYWGRLKRSFGRDIKKSLDYLLWTMSPANSNARFFENKKILDAGCGHGKFLLALKDHNCEVVGIDLTRAIDLCQDLVGDAPNVHLVQGDIINAPFKSEAFDYVYSSGVIHHTPNTLAAFKSLSRLPKKAGGVYSVWVYPVRAPWWEITQGFLRSITTKLHPQVLHKLSYIPVPLLSFKKFQAYSGTSLDNSSWAECAQVVFDFYGPKYQTHHTDQEICDWFKKEGYSNLHIGPDPTSVTGIRL